MEAPCPPPSGFSSSGCPQDYLATLSKQPASLGSVSHLLQRILPGCFLLCMVYQRSPELAPEVSILDEQHSRGDRHIPVAPAVRSLLLEASAECLSTGQVLDSEELGIAHLASWLAAAKRQGRLDRALVVPMAQPATSTSARGPVGTIHVFLASPDAQGPAVRFEGARAAAERLAAVLAAALQSWRSLLELQARQDVVTDLYPAHIARVLVSRKEGGGGAAGAHRGGSKAVLATGPRTRAEPVPGDRRASAGAQLVNGARGGSRGGSLSGAGDALLASPVSTSSDRGFVTPRPSSMDTSRR